MAACLKSFGHKSKVSVFKINKAWIHARPVLLAKRYNKEEFLQKSVVPTMHFQPSLPRLPIPKLEDTCQRYLMAQRPLLTPEQYKETKLVTETFQKNEGKALHAKLIEQDKQLKHTSYISGPWYDMYLKYRDSLVLNHNPFIVITDDPNNPDQLSRATKLIYSALRFKNSLDASILEPDVYHMKASKSDTKTFRNVTRLVPSAFSWYAAYMFNAYPLDMVQYARLFNSTRLPKPGKDELKTADNSKHMLVLRNGHIFVFDVVNEDGSLRSKSQIYENLVTICEQSEKVCDHPLAVMTAERRDKWFAVRAHLEKQPENARKLDLIDSAIFCVCLDDTECRDDIQSAKVFLHSDGYSRWFDKSFHLTLDKLGKAAINFEHSWGDGVAVVRFLSEIATDSATDLFVGKNPSSGDGNVRRLEFDMDDSIKVAIKSALETFQSRCSKLKLHGGKVEEFGRKRLRDVKMGPDAMMQLAFQMAYYRLTGSTAATYESCSTAAFKHGRTETLRSCTEATHACSKAFQPSHPAGVAEMKKLVMDASDVHSKLTKEAAMGQGFDRHLFALKYLSESSGQPARFFDHHSYKHINHIILSTSTVTNPSIQMGGFAPVVQNGLGVGYMVADSWLGCNCSSYPDSPNAAQFVELVFRSLRDIMAVLDGRSFKS